MYHKEIEKINEFLKEQLWMDFEMCSIGREKLELHGFLDETGVDKVVIVFEEPYMFSGNFFFTYEGGGAFLSVVDGEEAFRLNKRYGVTKGNIIFKISNIDVEAEMLIIAKNMEVQMIK